MQRNNPLEEKGKKNIENENLQNEDQEYVNLILS
jgi:hypothetical protein